MCGIVLSQYFIIESFGSHFNLKAFRLVICDILNSPNVNCTNHFIFYGSVVVKILYSKKDISKMMMLPCWSTMSPMRNIWNVTCFETNYTQLTNIVIVFFSTNNIFTKLPSWGVFLVITDTIGWFFVQNTSK